MADQNSTGQPGRLLSLFERMTLEALKASDATSLYTVLASHIVELFDATGCCITCWNEQEKSASVGAVCGDIRKRTWDAASDQPPASLTLATLRAGKPVVVDGATQYPDHLDALRTLEDVDKVLLAPLIAGTTELGALIVSFNETRSLTEHDINLAEQVSTQASLMIDAIQSREASQVNELRYRQIFEANKAVKLIIDPATGEIFDANESACEFYGYTRSQLLSMNIADINMLSKEEVQDRLDKASRQDQSLFRFRHRLSSGEIRDVEVFTGPLAVGDRTLIHSIVQDVSQRVRAEAALRASERHLEAAQRQVHLGSWQYFPTLDEVVWSQEIYRLLDWPQSQVPPIGEDFVKLIDRENQQYARDAFNHTLTTGERTDYQFRTTTRDGDARYIAATITRVEADEFQPWHLAGTMQDVTEIIRLEEQLSHARKMEAVGRMAGGIAHDFNNFLTVILGNLELLGQATILPASLRALVEQSQHAAESAAALTRQLQVVSKKQVVQPRSLQPNELVESLARILPGLLPENIRTEIHLAEDLWRVRADPEQIERVLMNLVVNARDAMPDGGDLKITTENVSRASEAGDALPRELVKITVADSGEGIDDAVRTSMFEPFFTTKSSGTGLGLATVHAIVEQAGGFIEIDSSKDAGTRFDVFLPRNIVEAVDTSYVDINRQDDNQWVGTILLVEDDTGIRELTARVLTHASYRVFEAPDGDAALEIFKSRTDEIDLLLTDVMMPGDLNGPDLVEAVLRIRPGLPVCYMTGYAANLLPAERRDFELIEKPFRNAELLIRMADLLARGDDQSSE